MQDLRVLFDTQMCQRFAGLGGLDSSVMTTEIAGNVFHILPPTTSRGLFYLIPSRDLYGVKRAGDESSEETGSQNARSGRVNPLRYPAELNCPIVWLQPIAPEGYQLD